MTFFSFKCKCYFNTFFKSYSIINRKKCITNVDLCGKTEKRRQGIYLHLTPEVYGFSKPSVRSGGRERNSFHGVIPCSDKIPDHSRIWIPVFAGDSAVAEPHTPPLQKHCTTGSTDPALHQMKTTARGKLTTGNHSLEFHTATNIFLNVSSFTQPFLWPTTSPSPRQDSNKRTLKVHPSPLVLYIVNWTDISISCWLKSVFKLEDTSKEKCFNSTIWWIFDRTTFGMCSHVTFVFSPKEQINAFDYAKSKFQLYV